MKTIYHESTGNFIYESDSGLFSSSNPSRIEQFETMDIKSRFDFESIAQANQMLCWGNLPIAEEFLDDYNYIMTYFNTYYKKDVNKLDVRVSMRDSVKDTTKLVYKEIFDMFIDKGYSKCRVYNIGINTYIIGFEALKKTASKNKFGYELVYSVD